MTRKDYRLIARLIAENSDDVGEDMHNRPIIWKQSFVDSLCHVFKAGNVRFRSDLFREACDQ